MTTTLRKSLGRIPYRYSVEDSLNDYQVVVNGPAGRAVITEIDGGDDYEIETAFYDQQPRLYYGQPRPAAAMCRVVDLNSTYLTNCGEEIPPTMDPRRIVAVLVLMVVIGILATLAISLRFDNSGEQPTAPVTWSPAPPVTATIDDMPAPTPGATR